MNPTWVVGPDWTRHHVLLNRLAISLAGRYEDILPIRRSPLHTQTQQQARVPSAQPGDVQPSQRAGDDCHRAFVTQGIGAMGTSLALIPFQ